MRMKEIIDAAMLLTDTHPLRDITREMVANQAGCTDSLINHYFTTTDKLRDAVLIRGIKESKLKIIAEAIIMGSPLVNTIPDKLKLKAVNYVFTRG
jgi:AcrR family transcriptional regulator